MRLPSHPLLATLETHVDPDAAFWDEALARLGGHPRQSALWGDARRTADAIRDCRIMLLQRGEPVWLMRFEKRSIPGFGVAAWVPGGPAGNLPVGVDALLPSLIPLLVSQRVALVITDQWAELRTEYPGPGSAQRRWTSWLDISSGRETLWRDLERQWRHGVRSAQRKGVAVERTRSPGDLAEFHALCLEISRLKHFRFNVSLELMKNLIARGPGPDVECELLVARVAENLVAGAFLMRCGASVHYFWGATNRKFSSYRGSEATQWAAIEWALERKCVTYDLEGGNPNNKTSVYRFKKKMGGRAIMLPGKQCYPLNARGKILGKIIALSFHR